MRENYSVSKKKKKYFEAKELFNIICSQLREQRKRLMIAFQWRIFSKLCVNSKMFINHQKKKCTLVSKSKIKIKFS